MLSFFLDVNYLCDKIKKNQTILHLFQDDNKGGVKMFFWFVMILIVLLLINIAYSLSVISYQLKLFAKHFGITARETVKISNDEIEKELDDEVNT